MEGFGPDFSGGGAAGGKMDTGTIIEQVKVQIAVANAQELLQRMTDKCFKKCIGKPGSSLDNSEQVCWTIHVIKMYCDVYGPVYGYLEYRVPCLQLPVAEGKITRLSYLLLPKPSPSNRPLDLHP
ncbi:hypothetical protein NHX12_032839 [Muraenolepis orangiensis]|uniref:Mitochondrial import inner membrane translocase subunit n=1 Tax=Muraenolepis orangiensis TaxID=630683 RepID=A0A9Q0E402_9TELE|nr:hypothetical protein NHX12_032839 [Muraenolepis orangiensis]